MARKQGCGEEGETREAREGKQGKTRRRVSMGQRGDPGEIQGRSIDLGGLMFRSVGRGRSMEGQGQQGILRVRGIEGGQ